MIGQSISHYKILQKLGEGGMGVVYKAQDTKLDRTVALKFLPQNITPTETEKKRFIHEAKAASSLDHPNICTVYEIDETSDGQMFLAMAFYGGALLSEKIKQGPLKIDEALEIAIQAAEGLQSAHEKGIIHRDIKSSNLMLTEKGQVKLMDFGLAKSTGASMLTKSGATVGTVPYMSPEQARGEKVDHRTDIWSLGVVLYEMISGRLPFESPYSEAVVYSILNEEPKPFSLVRSDVPAKVEIIVKKCLQKNPANRYQQADELLADLRRAEADPEKVEQKVPKTAKFQWRNWYLIAGAALFVTIFLTIFIPRFTSNDEGIRSIAVLPLENLSHDPEQEYFADGMTEALITDLAKISSLRVISRTSVMLYKTRKKTVPEIAKELNVDVVVEGSVQRSGDRVRITAQLIHASTDKHLWAESYERSLTDILSLQSNVAMAIVKEIRAKVTPQEETRLASSRPVNKEAHDLYLRGNFFMQKSDQENLDRALTYFRQALEKDPEYALPYAGIANTYANLADAYLPPRDAYPKAKAAALKALELDSTIAEARAVLAFILGQYDRDPTSAEREFQHAVASNPNSVDTRVLYAFFLSPHLNHSEALAQLDHAISVDPLSPVASSAKEIVLLWARQYDGVIEQHRRTAELDPNFFYMDSFVGAAYREKGMFKETLTEYFKAQKLMPEQPLHGLAITYARLGRRAEAMKILLDLETYSTRRYVPKSTIGMIYVALGDKDRAFEWFERAYEERDVGHFIGLAVAPEYDPVRSDPRYASLLKKLGLPASESSTSGPPSIINNPVTETLPNWQNSIAVLPFKNISADKEQEYFCDGMTEQLITNLTNLPNVKVIARTTVMQFKNTDKTIQRIAQELGVAHVLEGSVRKAGNKIRVTAQLIKADDGFHLWAKDYDRHLKDIFAVQDDVSNAIVQALKVELPNSPKHSMVATAPKNSEAYDLYLRGNFFLRKSDQESLNRALDYFQKSIEKDRSYAPPYAGIAYAYATLADAYLPPKDAYPKAKIAALRALELDSTIAEARAALAFILGAYERDQLSSQREFRRAMEFNPNSVDVLWLSALYLGTRTGSAEAIALADRAIALDPLNPFASWTKEFALLVVGQHDEVIEQHKRTVELDPNFFYSDSHVGLAYREKGMLKEALDEYMKVQKHMPGQPLFGLAALHARMGKRQEAKNILRDLLNQSKKRYVAPTGIAKVCIALGEKDLAFDWLDRAYEAHDTFLNGLKMDVSYDPIRSDPRYAVLLKKMGFEK